MQDNQNNPTGEAPAPTSPETTPTPAATPVVPPVQAAAPSSEPTAQSASSDTTSGPTAPSNPQPGAKNHLVAVLLSIFVGGLGVDRFYLGHIGLGVAKLLLSWATFGIWWLIDVILIATRKVKNVTWES